MSNPECSLFEFFHVLILYFSRVQEFKVALSEKNIDLKALRDLCFSGNLNTLLYYSFMLVSSSDMF